ncbi:hypothetical protein [Acinetobacter sp. CFCC 10889]|uniref:hypothetical protein n=1 Tax=Acinetobacter sp. CFCC 10889 TaxID=1775557 RepID=UPI00148C0078|nr:hypothetical protein [Acinetobacter sp. CFCC 10889]
MLTTGKDYDYVRDQMDLPRLYALNEYQVKFPPADIGVQRLCRILEAFMGIEDHSNPQEVDDEDDLEEMLNAFPQG